MEIEEENKKGDQNENGGGNADQISLTSKKISVITVEKQKSHHKESENEVTKESDNKGNVADDLIQ